MNIEMSPLLTTTYPNLKPIEEGDKILSICSVDGQRCLDPRDPEEDYSIRESGKEIVIIRVFTAFAGSCTDCKRNTSPNPGETTNS